MTASPDDGNVYAVTAFDDVLLGFIRDTATGTLTLTQTFPEGSLPGLDGGNSIVVSPNGRRAYVGASKALIAFARDTTTGELTFLETIFDGPTGTEAADTVSGLTTSTDGRYLYAVSRADRAISTFTIASLFSDGFESGDMSAWSATVP